MYIEKHLFATDVNTLGSKGSKVHKIMCISCDQQYIGRSKMKTVFKVTKPDDLTLLYTFHLCIISLV